MMNLYKYACSDFLRLLNYPSLHHIHSTYRIQEEFINMLEVVVKRKNLKKIWVDEQWLTEKEMKDDFKWSPNLG